jgi:hypothetical protein
MFIDSDIDAYTVIITIISSIISFLTPSCSAEHVLSYSIFQIEHCIILIPALFSGRYWV